MINFLFIMIVILMISGVTIIKLLSKGSLEPDDMVYVIMVMIIIFTLTLQSVIIYLIMHTA